MFILEKELIGYKEISLVSFEPQAGVDILINKTNGYHDIMLAGSNSFAPKIRFVARIKDALCINGNICAGLNNTLDI